MAPRGLLCEAGVYTRIRSSALPAAGADPAGRRRNTRIMARGITPQDHVEPFPARCEPSQNRGALPRHMNAARAT